jgi:pilus assembly protein Flp/PilA
MLKKLMAKMQNEEGQGLVEYALIIALIAIICIAGLRLLAPQINATLGAIATAITPA